MPDVMAVSLQAMQGDAARLDRVSANLANALTPGYKREIFLQRAAVAGLSFASLVDTQAATALAAGAGRSADPAGVIDDSASVRDLRVGTLKATGQPLDFALTGKGYFEVATPAGPAYTRHGQFRLDPRGRLVTAQGHAVLGTGGEIVLTGAPSVDAAGTVSEDGRVVAKLRVVDFEDARNLRSLGDGLYAGASGAAAIDERDAPVRQGHLENANVDSMREMVELVRTMRHFESVQRVVQGYDEMLGTAIRKLGDV